MQTGPFQECDQRRQCIIRWMVRGRRRKGMSQSQGVAKDTRVDTSFLGSIEQVGLWIGNQLTDMSHHGRS